ncbi:MAG TPA: 4-hydroxybenzoate octaprenyltransferase [Aestuariivirgaceae bacterium]|jgi:4-hydroxybenzoate polyprenyltransferase
MSQRTEDQPVADRVRRHWVDRVLPQTFRPYARLARLERPIGWWLLLLPGWWSIALAKVSRGGGLPDLKLLALFLLGAVIMRGAGCTLNDIADRHLDAKVKRTKSRPIPSGQVTVVNAIVFLVVLCAAGLFILLQLNRYSIVLGAASLVLVAIYPFMKRVTHWPQLFLGLAFNWGALLGWSAVTGRLDLPALCLYAGGVFWTLAYDTIYAHQDKEDDALIGVKSTALRLGSATKIWLAAFFFFSLALIDLAGILAGANIYFHLAVVGAAFHASWQLSRLDIDDPNNCLRIFRSNRDFGVIVFLGALLASMAEGLFPS